MSSEDIDKGQRWAAEVGEKLGDLGQGVLCVTRENANQPWLNFEAGALAKSLGDSCVRPVLFDIRPSDLTGPLSLFQATVLRDRGDMLKFIESVNKACAAPLNAERLRRAFERSWPDFEKRILAIDHVVESGKASKPQRSSEEMLSELLDRVRIMHREIVHNDRKQPRWPVDSEGNTLKAGETVTYEGMTLTIADMVRRGGRWYFSLVNSKNQIIAEVDDIEAIRWVPF